MTVSTQEKGLQQLAFETALAPRHYKEWQESAVNDNIIKLNVSTIYDGREVDRILNINSTRRWKHSDALVPAWCVSGIDPLTGEPNHQGVQVKPDTAPLDKNGRPLKYLGAKDFEAAPLFLNTGNPDYWKQLADDTSTPIFITEGAKKAGCLLSHSLPCISIPGVSTCRKKGRLHQNIDLFAKVGRKFYLCFDNDVLHKDPVRKALIGLSRELAANVSKVFIIQLPQGEAKGIDDYIASFGIEAFNLLVENALTFEEWLEEIKNQESEEEEFQPKSKLAKHFKVVESGWGENLRYNTLTKEVELLGRELNEDEVRLVMALQFDFDITITDAQTIIRNLAKRDSYSPVVEYLKEVELKHPDIETSFLDGLAYKYFGTDDPIHATYFKKFLVASVARAKQPGCKVDNVFMLLSPEQGKFKSTFFSVLFGDDFFSDQLGVDINNKDEKMKISQYWCLEWSEFDAIYKKKDVSSLKNFITNRTDTFRAPYARKDAKHPRPCVFVGTSNQTEILHDETGSRRFWPLLVLKSKIPIDLVQQDRDKLWSAANKLYQSGFQWWLTDQEEITRAENSKEYQSQSYWDEVIEAYWAEMGRPEFLPTEGIVNRLGFESAKELKPFDNSELTKSMTRLGFTRSKNGQRINGIQRRGWEKRNNQNFKDFSEIAERGVSGVSVPLHKDFSRHTSDTPPVSGVSDNQNEGLFNNNKNNLSVESNNSSMDAPDTPPVSDVCQPETSHIKTDTPDTPVTPNIQHLREEDNHSVTTVDIDKFAIPQADDHYRLLKVPPIKFTIETNIGKCEVRATPFKKIKSSGQSVIHLLYEMEMGRAVDQVKCVLDKKSVQQLAKKSKKLKSLETAIAKKWEERAKVETYRVLKVGGLHDPDIWIENCELKSVPGEQQHFFYFDAPDGTRFNASIGGFVVMKND